MMKVLVINGSPRGEKSNSLRLAEAFLKGLGETETRYFHVAQKQIAACRGCFACWSKTPGKCVIADDAAETLRDQLWADVIVWSFPLYFYSVPGALKNLIDRQLPMSLPFMAERTDGCGNGGHPSRYDVGGKKHVVISTCGFYTAEGNYDGVCSLFDHMCGAGNYETVFCGEGELFRVPAAKPLTDMYLENVRRGGEEYARDGRIGPETRAKLSELLLPKEVFEAQANASWGVSPDGQAKADETLTFTRQMAAMYRKESWDGKDRVLEIRYTDRDRAYQLLLGKDGCPVTEDCARTPDTVIETPWDVWQQVSSGAIRGDEAIMKGLYRIAGDFTLMMRWNEFFGAGGAKQE